VGCNANIRRRKGKAWADGGIEGVTSVVLRFSSSLQRDVTQNKIVWHALSSTGGPNSCCVVAVDSE
jgi:hypothetical protein